MLRQFMGTFSNNVKKNLRNAYQKDNVLFFCLEYSFKSKNEIHPLNNLY